MQFNKELRYILVKSVLGLFLILSVLFLIFGELFYPHEDTFSEQSCQVFEADWERVLEDGTREPFTVPGQCVVPKKQWIAIETTLPSDQEHLGFCVRSLQQEIRVYVGDELRKEYSSLDTQPFGTTSTITYVFFDVFKEDAGKTLRLELMTDSSYTGYVDTIFVGEKSAILKFLVVSYAPVAIMAVILLLISIGICICSIVIRIIHKRGPVVFYLGVASFIVSMWLLCESRLRQFVLPDATTAMNTGFLLIMLLPYPFALFINKIQKERYRKVYMTICCFSIINTIYCVSFQLLNIRDFFETMTTSHMIILALIIVMAVTIILDLKSGKINEYKSIATGMAILMLMGIVELGLVYFVSTINGVPLCIGLVVLLAATILESINDVYRIERERMMAIAEGESKSRFLANMSHEIRTPINSIIGMNEMILRENDDPVIAEYANNANRASHMLLSIINDILDFSKFNSGNLRIVENDYFVSSMIKDVVYPLKNLASDKKLEFDLDIDSSIPSVLRGDDVRIKQILNNLLSNAIKYTEKGSVTLSIKPNLNDNDCSLVISVKDTGIGIKQQDIECLFDSFRRLELEKNRNIQGTGLGLNITKQLVDAMKGTIDVESVYGKGSCFTVVIPQQVVNSRPIGSFNNAVEVKEDKKKSTLDLSGTKIMVVDDNKMNLMVIEALLKRTNVEIDTATSGDICMDYCRNKKYDLIFMDHMMPSPDGIETLHMLREDKYSANQDTKVIVLTANVVDGIREEYIKEGFVDYLAKPVKADELERMLKEHIGRQSTVVS